MELNMALLVYAVLQFFAFLFVLVATPIDMFLQFPDPPIFHACFTLWGFKDHCNSVSYYASLNDLWDFCPRRLRLFRAAGVLAIISIFIFAAAFVLGVSMLFCCFWLRFVCLGLNIVGAVTLGFVWVAMVVTFLREDTINCEAMKEGTVYGAGFALFITAWVLDIINILVLVFSIYTTAPSASDQVEQKEGKLY
nr:unnamed protein product [Leishmania braziliensis]